MSLELARRVRFDVPKTKVNDEVTHFHIERVVALVYTARVAYVSMYRDQAIRNSILHFFYSNIVTGPVQTYTSCLRTHVEIKLNVVRSYQRYRCQPIGSNMHRMLIIMDQACTNANRIVLGIYKNSK